MFYKNRDFLSPPEIGIAEKFQKFVFKKMKKDGMNRVLARFLIRGISKLER